MSEFKLDGSRPMMASITLKSMRNIISLLEHELTEGEFESDVEFSMIKELLDECRQAGEIAGQIVWHPVQCVPYDPEKHNEDFDVFDDKPMFVWEGELPEEEVEVLVSCRDGNSSWIGITHLLRDDQFCWFDSYDDTVIAWAELPEPYKPRIKENKKC